jgi:hypothetical protein
MPRFFSLFLPSEADWPPSAPSLKTRGTLKPKALISRRISGFPRCCRHWNRFFSLLSGRHRPEDAAAVRAAAVYPDRASARREGAPE